MHSLRRRPQRTSHLLHYNREDVAEYWERHLSGEEKRTAAFMAVGRAKDSAQRNIWACMGGNFAWRRPEEVLPSHFFHLGMRGAAALGLITCDDREELYWGTMDCAQAFTSLLALSWMWAWNAGPPLRARFVPKKY